jgi:CBS-domain-containing membrane protein
LKFSSNDERQVKALRRTRRGPTRMTKFLERGRGAGGKRPPHLGARAILLGGLGGFLAIGALAFLSRSLDVMLLLGSFGASCVLLFGYPDAPFAQPANVIGGHVICTVIGLAALHWLGPQPWVLALAVGCSIAAMMATRTVHPPAGSNPVIVFLGHSGWGFLLFPVVSGALILVLIAWAYNNAVRKTPYPHYW